ncbi:hypothetical protein PBMFNG_PBMFNG_02060, partial [Dysosmobacter welbionis]
HIVAGGQDVVQTAEADVVGPAVAAEDPHGLLGQELLVRQNLSSQLAGVTLAQRLALCLQLLAEGMDLRLGIGQQLVHSADAALQGGDVCLGGLAVGGAVLHGVQPLLAGLLQSGH